MLNLDLHKLPEDSDSIPLKEVHDIIQTYKLQISLSLDQVGYLAVLSSSVFDPKAITSLLELKQELYDNVIQTGMFRARRPWSAAIQRIDQFVKQFFPTYIEQFEIRELKLLPTDMRDSVIEGRKTN